MEVTEGVALGAGLLVLAGAVYVGATKMAEKSAEAAQAKADAAVAQAKAEAALLEANARAQQQPTATTQTQQNSGGLQWLQAGVTVFNGLGGIDGIAALIGD